MSSASPAPASLVHRKITPAELLEKGGLIVFLAALVIFFMVVGSSAEDFRSSANIDNILRNQSVTALVAIAMVVPLVCGYFDLAVPAIVGMSNIAVASITGEHGGSLLLAIVVALGLSLFVGCLNGILVAYLRLHAFIVTLAMYTLGGGVLLWYTEGETITSGLPQALTDLRNAEWVGLPAMFIILMLFALAVWYMLMQSPFGRQLEAVGSNERAAHLIGIHVQRRVFASFLISAFIAGIAGIVLTASAGNADPNAGPAYLFPGLAAVFLGATSIRPGRYNVWGTLLGVFVIAVAVNGLTFMGADTWVTPFFNGMALLVAVALSTFMSRHRAEHAPEVVTGPTSARPAADTATTDAPVSVNE